MILQFHTWKKLNNLGTCIQEGKFLHLRCIAHIINLIVTYGLKKMNESVACVRGAVRYMRQSPVRLAKFKECVIIEKLKVRVCCVWMLAQDGIQHILC